MTLRRSAPRVGAAIAVVALALVLVPTAAVADGTVVVHDATELTNAVTDGTTDRIEFANDITIAAEITRPNAADPLVIDGFGHTLTQSANARILETFGATGALTLENITITGANPLIGQGGAVHWVSGDVTVRNSTFVHNKAASQGAAILMGGGTLVISDSTFDDTNTGAIFGPSVVQVTNSVFTRNLGTGAIAASNAFITGSTFTGNQGVVGGAITVGGDLTLTETTVSGNSSCTVGGGFAAGEDLRIIRSTISGNTSGTCAGGNGGGAYNNGLTTYIENSTISNNTALGATSAGGGLFFSGTTTIVYSTIAGNTAADGANISTFEAEGSLEVFGSVLAYPNDPDRTGVIPAGTLNCTNVGTGTSLGYAYESGGLQVDSCGFGNATGDVNGGADPLLRPLASNGGPTQTRLPDFVAAAIAGAPFGNPLVDVIPPSACSSGPVAGVTIDQRGVSRPQGPACDIGAVEQTVPAPEPLPTDEPKPLRFTG